LKRSNNPVIVISVFALFLCLIETGFFSIFSLIAVLDRSGNLYLHIARAWALVTLFILGIRLRVSGLDHLRPGEHYVYVANHASLADIPIVLAAIPHGIRLVMRNTLTRVPIWGWSMLASPYLIINRTNATEAERTLRTAIAAIRNGASVLLFPEGTRTPTGQMQSFKRGAFHLAYDSGAAILPVAIVGTYEIIPRHEWLPRWGRRVEVQIGEAIYPREAPPESARAEEIRLMRQAERSVRELIAICTTSFGNAA
jgi:1-acyl-sn-glycerol-3-phosphate acyltransferase